MGNIFTELESLIEYIQSEYSTISEIWLNQRSQKINLKKKNVCDVDLNGEIYTDINEYVKLLNEKTSNIPIELSTQYSNFYVTTRVKTQNSIEFKIQNYKSVKEHEYGKVPVIKCINDLFGIRIILKEPLTYNEICSFVIEKYGDRYKCINSSKLDYKATHLYFKKNNNTFPWELQIWNECDRESNFNSHKKYKQEYTTWEKEAKEGGIINEN